MMAYPMGRFEISYATPWSFEFPIFIYRCLRDFVSFVVKLFAFLRGFASFIGECH
jgi:hypothetical protein